MQHEAIGTHSIHITDKELLYMNRKHDEKVLDKINQKISTLVKLSDDPLNNKLYPL